MPYEKNIREEVLSFLENEFGVKKDRLQDDTQLRDLTDDSMDLVRAILTIEERYDLSVPNKMKDLTLGRFIDYLEKNYKPPQQ